MHVRFDALSGVVHAGAARAPFQPVGSDGAIQVGGPRGPVLRPVSFGERNAAAGAAMSSARHRHALCAALAARGVVRDGALDATLRDVLLLALAGADREPAPSFADAALNVLRMTARELDALLGAPAIEVDRLSIALLEGRREAPDVPAAAGGWTRFEIEPAAPTLAELRDRLADALLLRATGPAGAVTLEQATGPGSRADGSTGTARGAGGPEAMSSVSPAAAADGGLRPAVAGATVAPDAMGVGGPTGPAHRPACPGAPIPPAVPAGPRHGSASGAAPAQPGQSGASAPHAGQAAENAQPAPHAAQTLTHALASHAGPHAENAQPAPHAAQTLTHARAPHTGPNAENTQPAPHAAQTLTHALASHAGPHAESAPPTPHAQAIAPAPPSPPQSTATPQPAPHAAQTLAPAPPPPPPRPIAAGSPGPAVAATPPRRATETELTPHPPTPSTHAAPRTQGPPAAPLAQAPALLGAAAAQAPPGAAIGQAAFAIAPAARLARAPMAATATVSQPAPALAGQSSEAAWPPTGLRAREAAARPRPAPARRRDDGVALDLADALAVALQDEADLRGLAR